MGESIVYDTQVLLCAEEVANQTKDVLADPWKYIECFYGPQVLDDLSLAISLTAIYALILVTGLLGNIAVCIVIVKQPTLHTATNYYLFNLAVSDVTLLVSGLPHEIFHYWHQYPWVLGETICKGRALVSEMSSYVSVLTIIAFSTERFIGVCYPLSRRAVSSLHRVIVVIGCLWIIALMSAIPFVFSTQVHYLTFPPRTGKIIWESAMCAMVKQPENVPLTELSTGIFFVLPFCVLAVQYASIGITIWKSSKNTIKGGSIHRKTQAKKNTIKMLFFIVLAFFFCWAPFHLQRVLCIYMDNDDESAEIKNWAYIITGIFYYFSSTANPILYNIMSERMRNGFKEIFCNIKQQRLSQNMSSRKDRPVRTQVSLRTSTFTDTEDVTSQDVLLYREIKRNVTALQENGKLREEEEYFGQLRKYKNETCV